MNELQDVMAGAPIGDGAQLGHDDNSLKLIHLGCQERRRLILA